MAMSTDGRNEACLQYKKKGKPTQPTTLKSTTYILLSCLVVVGNTNYHHQTTREILSTPGKVAWLVTVNNPTNEEKNPETLLKNSAISGMIKYCKWANEEGEAEGTPHIHIYVHLSTQQRFSAIKAIFPKAHID